MSTRAADWPDPDTLDARRIDDLFMDLRGQREDLLQRLSQLERQSAGNRQPSVLIDQMEARFHLNRLMGYWRQLLARALLLQDWAPLGSEPPQFTEMEGDTRYCAARALVPLTPDSLMFVHGPVTLWHAAALAERLLQPGEALQRSVKSAFRRELTVEPRIIIWDDGLPKAPVSFDDENVAVSGVFETDRGRTLAFVALADTGCVPRHRAGWHPVTASIIAARPAKSVQPMRFSHRLTETQASVGGGRGSAALLAKMEAFLAVLTQHILVGERVLLLSRTPPFAIDIDFSDWLATSPELQFEIDWPRQKPIPGRGSYVPVRYRALPDEPHWQRSMLVCLDSHIDQQSDARRTHQ